MTNSKMIDPANVPTEELVAADAAGKKARENGGGDIAEYRERETELATIRDRKRKLAAIDRDSAYDKAELWGGERGRKMIENADKVYMAAVTEANEAYGSALALFAAQRKFTDMIPTDQMAVAVASLFERQIRPLIPALQNLLTAGGETVDLGDGRVFLVKANLDLLTQVMADLKVSDAGTSESDGTEGDTNTETATEVAA